MNNKLPKALEQKQELKRQETINRVLRAINEIKTQGGKITIKNLMEITGLSRSVFSKPHIRELLEKGNIKPVSTNTLKPNTKNEQISALRQKNAELEHELELLRGELFLAMNK